MTREEATNVLGDVRAYLASRASLENEILAGHTFTDICNAIKTLEQEGYYKDLAQIYEGTIVQLTEAIAEQHSDDCVSRQAVLDTKVLIELPDGQSFYCISPEDVEELPPVTPTRKTGKWILTDDDFVYCSECEDSYYPRPIDASWYYCPNCGAEMESEE